MSEEYLQSVDVNLDSAICYVDVEYNDTEFKTETLENGFSAEMEQDMCDTKIARERRSDGESCPVGLHKAALLYPLHEGKPEHCMCWGCFIWYCQKPHPLLVLEVSEFSKSCSSSVEKLFKM